jgi:hypothetical protein
MSKLYIFGIGGTGSRVLRSLTMMLASGVKIGVDSIVPIIIDPDIANADLTRTINWMNDYSKIHDNLKFSEGSKNKFFKTPIEQGPHNYTLSFENIGGTSFESFIGFDELSKEDKVMIQMLFSEKNLESKMDVGFKGNPNIGSVVLNQIFESEGFENFANSFNPDDKIFIISSIFGGTGASGFPMLLKTLRNSDKFQNCEIINKSNIGAVTILPYFKVASDTGQEDSHEINSSTFISKTKSALGYYQKTIFKENMIDFIYFLADAQNVVYNYSEGGSSQKNDAHLIEFMAATSIIDFTFRPTRHVDDAITTQCLELGIKDTEGSVNFTNLYDGLHDMLYGPLTQFVLMANAFNNDLNYLKNTLAATKTMPDFYSSKFFTGLRNFTEQYIKWLNEMSNNSRSLPLYNMNCGKKPFDVVNGVQAKNSIISFKKDYEFFEAKLNKASIDAKKIEKDSDSSYFMEFFYRATEKIINEKLNS